MTPIKDTQTHTPKAVAIKGADSALGEDGQSQPKIIAKGSGALAEKILDIAFAEGVKVRQDKDLTEILDAFDVESPIPLEALHAVSLILERVYAENNKMSETTMKNTDDKNVGDNDVDNLANAPDTRGLTREDRPDG